MARYDIFKQLQELMSIIKTEKGFSKMVQTPPEYQYADYGVGFLELTLTKYKRDVGWEILFRLETIDDGGYVGRKMVSDEDKADKIMCAILENIIRDMVMLPPMEELNKILIHYGIYVVCSD